MRKRNIAKVADTIIWSIIYLMPIISYLIYLWSFGQNSSIVVPGTGAASNSNIVNFSTFLANTSMINGLYTTLIYDTLWSIFGIQNNAILGIITHPLCLYFTYFVSAVLVHLVVDFLLFIPRFAMRYMDEFTKE